MSKHLVTDASVAEANSIDSVTANTATSEKRRFYNREVNLAYLIVVVVLYLVATANIGFFKQVLAIYPFADNMGFLVSLTGLLFGLMWLFYRWLRNDI